MELHGKSVFGGIAMGRLSVYHKTDNAVKRTKITDIEAEKKRFEDAKEEAKRQLGVFYEKAVREVGEVNAAIFEMHQMMLDDLDYVESITNMIETQQVNAEFAVASTGDNFAQMFAAMDDDYMRERAADVKDISNRVISILQGNGDAGLSGDEPFILLADDLAPSETVQLDKSKVLAFVTRHGSTNSHTAILARTMNIPALIGVDFPEEGVDGQFGIVDGFDAKFFVEPDEDTKAEYRKLKEENEQKKRLLQELKGKENITRDGTKINLYANIGGVSDVANVLANDAGGIGLFRSEFLYLESEDYPTEEAQFAAYKTVAENMAGKKVIIRTLDIGADKQVGYFGLEKEENPAMGYRAIRICLDRTEIFKTQLRAIYRASYYGTIAIMFPMIISVNEVKKIKEIIAEVKAGLDADGIPYKDVGTEETRCCCEPQDENGESRRNCLSGNWKFHYFSSAAEVFAGIAGEGKGADITDVCRHINEGEWLNSKAKTARKYSTVFYRGNSDSELDLSGLPKNSRDNIKIALEKQVLIASLGAKLKISKCKAIRDWFLTNEFADFGDPVTNFFLSRRLPRGFVDDKNVQQKVVEYFASFDEHIKDFRVEKVPSDGESKEEKYKINALHKKIDSDEMAEIPLGAESAGTLKMFALYPELQEVLEKGSVFFIDELNARLHPLLVRNFLLTFLNPNINVNHAQQPQEEVMPRLKAMSARVVM